MRGGDPDQEAIDAVRREARLETLHALSDLELFVRDDEGMGGVDAIRLAVLAQQVVERVRVYRMAVNIGEEAATAAWLAEYER